MVWSNCIALHLHWNFYDDHTEGSIVEPKELLQRLTFHPPDLRCPSSTAQTSWRPRAPAEGSEWKHPYSCGWWTPRTASLRAQEASQWSGVSRMIRIIHVRRIFLRQLQPHRHSLHDYVSSSHFCCSLNVITPGVCRNPQNCQDIAAIFTS